MSGPASQNNDKNIVEKRVMQAGEKSRRAVKNLRHGVSSVSPSEVHFPRELLQRHAKLQLRSKYLVLTSVLLGAFLAYRSVGIEFVMIWLAGAIVCGLGVVLAAHKFINANQQVRLTGNWERNFLFLHGVFATAWAAVFAIHPLNEVTGIFSMLLFAGCLVLMALALVLTNNLKYGVVVATFPFVTVIAGRLAIHGTIASLAMAVVVISGCFFFQRLGDWMRDNHLEHLKSKAERDQLIMELEAATTISDEARRRAEEANLAKSRFLATMSHELRTPLNAILGFSEVMSNEVMGPLNNEYYEEYVKDIHSSGAHLLKLINEILDLSRVEAGRYELNEQATNIAHVAEEAQQMVKLKATEKNIQLIMQIQPDMPQVWADERAVRQVILNLLSNALKFTPSGGTIWLKAGWTVGGGQYISIRDTGPGIAEDEIPVVLSSFGQGSIAIKSAEQGTGLGLPIVQALVHMHDGHFELKSKLREGTEVIATFPRKRVLEAMPAVPQGDIHKPAANRKLGANTRQHVIPPELAAVMAEERLAE